MTPKQHLQISKFLSLVLRHKPEAIGLTLDKQGWASTQALLAKMNAHDFTLSLEGLQTLVATSDKKRFVFSEDGSKIRANQGHSLPIDLGLTDQVPPATLFHGTAKRNLASIREQGLVKGQRHHVHLSADTDTAHKVGQRYGAPIVLSIQAREMYKEGLKFYQSVNGVWLTEMVPPEFIILG